MHQLRALVKTQPRIFPANSRARISQNSELSICKFHQSASQATEERPAGIKNTPLTRRAASAQAGQLISQLPVHITRVAATKSTIPQSNNSSDRPRILQRRQDGSPSSNNIFIRGGLNQRDRQGKERAVTGARASRGSRAGSRAPRGRRRHFGGIVNESDDFNLPTAVAPSEASVSSILESFTEHWRTDEEVDDYAELMELVEVAHAKNTEATRLLQEAEKRQDESLATTARGLLDAVGNDLQRGLDTLVDAHDRVFPNHSPQTQSSSLKPRGIVGGAPAGRGGFGTVVEDALRIVARREGHKYEEPRKLATRLIDGEIVKFADAYEKLVVTRLANEMGYKAHGSDGVGFEPLKLPAQGNFVQSLVSGHYESSEGKTQQVALRNMTRILGGNSTYTLHAQNTVKDTLSTMLPGEKLILKKKLG